MLADLNDRAQEIIARYPEGRSRSALLPLLHLVHAEEGHVSADGIAFCAETLGLTRAEVSAVATFYTMYKRRPAGDWLISVCTNTMCDVLGGGRVYEMLSEYLGVGHDETTPDGTITLEHAECLAACDYGPVMTVNYEFFDKVDVETALGIVTELQSGERPRPSRGARLCTLKEMSLQLAGIAGLAGQRDTAGGAGQRDTAGLAGQRDTAGLAGQRDTVGGAEADGWAATGVADGVAGEATLRTNRLAERYGISVADFDPDTPIGRPEPAKRAQTGGVPEANKPASDRKPAGDSPTPQADKLEQAGGEATTKTKGEPA